MFGAGGRMGTTVCAAVVADPGLELVAAVDPHHEGHEVAGTALRIAGSADALEAAGAAVAVDFTAADAARANLRWCAAHDVHAVVGTSGLDDADHDELRAAFTRSNVVVVPNFAIGAVLMMRFAELAAPWFDTAEIIELHHDGKIDAPSGTATATAGRMAAASAQWAPDPTTKTVLDGARGGVGPGGIHIHSVRLRGLVAHQEVLLGAAGQTLTLRHDSYDRVSFMPGVVLACKGIAERPGLTIGLESFLGL
ncbi:MAG TPA: 4-hydroxy-tetrahydrodipicolinate reductase [Acidimicrobiales bacterium]|nr:4-hydroxy-tetrahydrodipicolinate reductase [Acidimicrobiales bacterium]